MNRSERKGGRGGPGRRDREDKRPPRRIEDLPPSLVDRGSGWTIWKIGKVDQASHAPAGAEYRLVFEGHDPIVFATLGAARDRSKEPPPEKVETPEAAEVAESAGDGGAEEEAAPAEPPAEDA